MSNKSELISVILLSCRSDKPQCVKLDRGTIASMNPLKGAREVSSSDGCVVSAYQRDMGYELAVYEPVNKLGKRYGFAEVHGNVYLVREDYDHEAMEYSLEQCDIDF
jgi:hypothetical protein